MRRHRWSVSPMSAVTMMLVLALSLLAGACSDLASDDGTGTTAEPSTDTTAAANEQGQISAGNILFRDDFQDGDTDGWQVSGAWVVQQDGDLYTFDTTSQGYALVPAGVDWQGDYAFKSSYVLTAGTLAFSFDATSDGRYYVPIDQQRISLVKEDAAGEKTVLTQAQAPAVGALHYLTIAKQSGTIQVYVDRTLWLAAQDASPLTGGTIAVGSTDGTTASVDNVLVNKIGRALPQGTPAVAAIEPGQVVEPSDDSVDLNVIPDSDEDAPDLDDSNQGEDIPQPLVSFTARPEAGNEAPASSVSVPPFTNVVIEWSVENAQAVFFQGQARTMVDDTVVSTRESTTYELEVVALDGTSQSHYVDVTVIELVHGPDLSISCQVSVEETTKVYVSATISNNGDQSTEASFKWYAHEKDGVVTRSTTVSLASGESTTIGLGYDYGQSGTMHWKASVSTVPQGLDVDTSNNSVKGTVTVQK